MKKIVLLTLLLLTSVLLFAEEHTIISFNIEYKNNEKSNDNVETFRKTLANIVKENKADIVLLQEVYIDVPSIVKESAEKVAEDVAMKSLTKYFGGFWSWYTTVSDMHSFGTTARRTQNNAVLYKVSNFKSVNYLNKKDYETIDKNKNNMCKSTFNNVQALEFINRSGESFFVVNVHVSPHETFNIKIDSQHTIDFVNLNKFINILGKDKPLILGGDMNFSTESLRKMVDSRKWIVDGDEVISSEPWVTTTSLNSWDHFVFNQEFQHIVVPKKSQGFIGEYSMRHALYIDEKNGVEISPNVYLSLGKNGDYGKMISDHFPICITIKNK